MNHSSIHLLLNVNNVCILTNCIARNWQLALPESLLVFFRTKRLQGQHVPG